MKIQIMSWGRKHGHHPAGFVAIDCTALRNPHFIPELRELNGLDPRVDTHVRVDPQTAQGSWAGIQSYAAMQIGKGHTKLAFVCIGGRHRSVAAAEAFASWCRNNMHDVTVEHRHINV